MGNELADEAARAAHFSLPPSRSSGVLFAISIVSVYMDDILIFSNPLEEHIRHLTIVFERLNKYSLRISLEKYEFLLKEITFLGHTVNKDGIFPLKNKIEATQNY